MMCTGSVYGVIGMGQELRLTDKKKPPFDGGKGTNHRFDFIRILELSIWRKSGM
jgi:hypothetical protein